ncbi:MAG: hypothetical protein HY243_17905 [Proteobacteria bacterium]|nr:hypothetical protein [Pseudomonadota bacterium]
MSLTDKKKSVSKVDPTELAAWQSNLNAANALASRPYQAYSGETVAPFTPTQLQGQKGLLDVANNNVGGATLDAATAANAGLLSGITPDMISKFFNPYQSDVIDTTMGDLERQRQMAQLADNQKASAAHAFGGDRQAVLNALTNEASQRTAASALANLNQQGWQAALQAALGSAGVQSNAAGQAAALSADQLQQALTRAGAVNQVGDTQQALQQKIDEANKQAFLDAWNYPLLMQQLKNQALGVYPTGSYSKSTDNQGILGAIGGLVGNAASLAQAGGTAAIFT